MVYNGVAVMKMVGYVKWLKQCNEQLGNKRKKKKKSEAEKYFIVEQNFLFIICFEIK